MGNEACVGCCDNRSTLSATEGDLPPLNEASRIDPRPPVPPGPLDEPSSPPAREITFDQIVKDIVELNDHVEPQSLTAMASFYNDGTLKSWRIFDQGLKELPESFGSLHAFGDLDLSSNLLTSLPDSFSNVVIGGNCNLQKNQLGSLPERIDGLTVGGHLNLCYNHLQSLPASFSDLQIGGRVNVRHNPLLDMTEEEKVSVGISLSERIMFSD